MGGMEAALASGVLKIVGDKLAPLVIKEFSSVMGVTKDLRELQDLVEEIKSWLRAVGDRSIENQPSFNWLKGLKDVAYDVEDLVDEFHLEAEKHEVYAAGDKHIVAKYLSAKQKSVLFRWTTAHKIKTIRKKFHAIVKNRSDVSTIVNNLPVDPVQDTNKTIGELPLLGNVGESYIRVRDMEKRGIISKLVEINDGEKIRIISIVGLGGTGKTTLAKHICQDNETKGHFESTFLVHVSRDFEVVKLIKKLVEAVVDAKSELDNLQHMSRAISEKLSGRKFLLVLDDVWKGDQHDWEPFMLHINNGAPGSRILLTSRDQIVAEALGSTRIFNLAFLSENDSWKLFQQSLGWAEQDLLDSEFTQVGKEIVMKCGGVPLAIKVLAGVLRQKRRINAWQAIRESNLWNEQDIELISRFEHLGHLKISKVNCEALPDALSHCWNLQALHVIGCTRLVMLPEFIGNLKKLRILEMAGSWDLESLPQSIGDCCNLQSLHLLNCHKLREIPDSIGKIENLKVLRIVDCWNLRHMPLESFGMLSNLQMQRCDLQELPSSFPRCTLRRLELSGTRLTILPQCITLLSGLEYIDLKCCRELVVLPDGIQSLKRLEVLNLQGCDKLRGLPARFGQLTCLRRLGLFVIGGSGDDALISDLEHLDMVSGKLEIRNIAYVKDEDDAEKAYLKRKDNIQELSLAWYSKWEVWTSSEEEFDMEKDLVVLNGLEPPSQIEALEISGYRGLHLPRWMRKQSDSSYLTGMLSNVKKSPSQFRRLSKLTLGELPNLTHLLISLETLELKAMPNLVELWSTVTGLANEEEQVQVQCCFPRLSTLALSHCPKLNVKPYFPPSLERLEFQRSNEQPLLCTGSFHLLHLKALELGGMPSSGWEFLEHLTGLQSLSLSSCNDLRQLPESMRSLTSLQHLTIEGYSGLGMLPKWLGEFRSLRHLCIKFCDALRQLPEEIGELRSLQHLEIFHLPALTSLPESMQWLTSLEHLNLVGCTTLALLPESIGQLSALRSFYIQHCPGLGSLPPSTRRLTALQNMLINGCPTLRRRCKEGVGEDWHLVSPNYS